MLCLSLNQYSLLRHSKFQTNPKKSQRQKHNSFLMAVEATHTHLNFFPPQLAQLERGLVKNPPNQGNVNISSYNGQQMLFPGIGTLPGKQSFYESVVCDSMQPKTSINTENNIILAPRKRSRDSIDQFKSNNVSQLSSFVGENILHQIQQYELEIDTIISQHTKKMRLEIQERQKQEARLLVGAIGEGVMRKLKEKEEQIQRIGKLNFVLQEKMKSLYVENQLWRDLAQTNEATANSLRSNLEQVLADVEQISARVCGGAAVEEDVESCCGSNGEGNNCYSDRMRCRRYGDRDSCVLMLPCRHLCLCNVCGSGSYQLQACPVCNSTMKATLHVNMSA